MVSGQKLVASIEPEKDTGARNANLSPHALLETFAQIECMPDVWAVGGWHRVLPAHLGSTPGGYEGLKPGRLAAVDIFGRRAWTYSTSHERTHILGAIAMAPFDENEIAVLVWEGLLGSFYRVRADGAHIERHEVLRAPGGRYAALYALAHPNAPKSSLEMGQDSGKLMALAGCADGEPPLPESVEIVEHLLSTPSVYPFVKAQFRDSTLFNAGVMHPEVARTARLLTDRLYEVFRDAAQQTFEDQRLPLVISGGCGLNCEWNTRWRSEDIFSAVFVPPVPNDSGSSIGAAVDALVQLGGRLELEWDVYAGVEFVEDDMPAPTQWHRRPLDNDTISSALEAGAVVAWIQGRCEIGPRALGNRSLLASATDPSSAPALNRLKRRESFRPVAPICRLEDAGRWFDDATPDPYMLYFRRVLRPDQLPSVTHRDGTARLQTVTDESNPQMAALLRTVRQRTGVGVLCNTSLNYPGRGFINRMSDLLRFADNVGIDHLVVAGTHFSRRASVTN